MNQDESRFAQGPAFRLSGAKLNLEFPSFLRDSFSNEESYTFALHFAFLSFSTKSFTLKPPSPLA